MKKPSKIICVGLNYKDHAEELGMVQPKHPIIFLKPVSSIIKNKEKILIPKMSSTIDYEAELAVVIGKKCRNVSEKHALDVVFGYTCLNDVTEREMQKKDGQWTRAKSFDTFCPIGPKIVKNINPNDLKIQSYLNGELKQDSHTSNFIFNVQYVISYISNVMTLEPGDIISTGTPKGVGSMKHNDEIKIVIEKIGTLINFVRNF